MQENYSKDAIQSIQELYKVIELFTPGQLNKIPFENSWTAAQIADHLWKSAKGLPTLFAGANKETERPVDEKIVILKSIFLDFTSKFKSPDFIIPDADAKDKSQLLAAIKKLEMDLGASIEKNDLSKTITGASLPQLGELTGYEWAALVYVHFTRHIRQIRNIYSVLNDTNKN